MITYTKCEDCFHYSGLWNNPVCPHQKYCDECVHNVPPLKDNFTVVPKENHDEYKQYLKLKEKFDKSK